MCEADFPGPLQRLRKYSLCAPVDLLEHPVVQTLQTDQVVAAVIRSAQHHAVSGAREPLDRLQQRILRHGGAIRIDQAHGAKAAGEQVLARGQKALSKTVASLW